MGTVAKDAFVVPETIDGLVDQYRRLADDPDTRWDDIDLADARVRIANAVERGAPTYPPLETDTWPACRPIVESVARSMSAGGRGYERRE
jgi:hypothetical protein